MEPSCCGLRSPGHPNLLSQHLPTSVPASSSGLCSPALPWSPHKVVALPWVLPAWSAWSPLCWGRSSQTTHRHPETPLWERGNLSPDSALWLKGSDPAFSAVKQWDENREKQQRSGALLSLVGLGAEPGVPCPGGEADGVPHV